MFDLVGKAKTTQLGCWASFYNKGATCSKRNPLLAKIRASIAASDFEGGAEFGMDGSVFSQPDGGDRIAHAALPRLPSRAGRPF